MRLTTLTAMLRHACSQQYGNAIEYMYQTCSKSIICLVLVNCNAMKSPIIQIFSNEDIEKTYNHKSTFYRQIVLKFFKLLTSLIYSRVRDISNISLTTKFSGIALLSFFVISQKFHLK